MRHDFDFECFSPPVVNIQTINARKENKKASLQIFLVILGSLFSIVTLLILAKAMATISPAIAFLCVAYVLSSLVGSGIVFTSYRHKGGAKVWLP